ncbi:hypothetical protein [Facklamia sp. 7083-14-GEN3]|uniref:hypothetical protein n=1 Tax=Facklamia sp. 7083-14-GEN3 TaxID=2973478 RepID=UPI00215C3FC5|nr:hypothetical protein [Facklamia sp. 7083-14-GEN3]MCR8968513.1 hypothetical protein [Facklamia sp. 7083-14-GEN3]
MTLKQKANILSLIAIFLCILSILKMMGIKNIVAEEYFLLSAGCFLAYIGSKLDQDSKIK